MGGGGGGEADQRIMQPQPVTSIKDGDGHSRSPSSVSCPPPSCAARVGGTTVSQSS